MNLARGLRGRLLLVTVLVLAAGMSTASAASYLLLDRHLALRRDQVVDQVLRRLAVEADVSTRQPFDAAHLREVVPTGLYVALYDPRGRLVLQELPRGVGSTVAAALPGPAALPVPRTVPLGSGSAPLRLTARVLAPGPTAAVLTGGAVHQVTAVVVGLSLADDADTLARLRLVLLLVGVVCLALLVTGAHVVLTLGLAPLRHLADVAHDVASGRTSRRASAGAPGSETGRVALALNAAFDASDRSAAVLRRFVDDVSHELRTPLATISGWADLYGRGGLREWEDVDVAVGHIHAEAARMAVLVDTMLTLARLDAEQPLERHDVDLDHLCREVVDGARVTHPDRSVTLAADGRTTTCGDPAALRRVVTNVLDNALHHTAGDVSVEVSRLGTTARVVVTDAGPGLAPEQLARAFDRFWRAGEQAPTGGTGLGLSIARDLARAHGGELSLAPGPQGGLRATLSLPQDDVVRAAR